MKKLSVFEYHRQSMERKEDVNGDERSGQLQKNKKKTDANVNRVWTLVHSDQSWNV